MLLLVAGFETTTNLLGNGVRVVLGDPAAGAGLLARGEVPPAAFVEEVLRYDSPVQFTERPPPDGPPSRSAASRSARDDHLVVMARRREPRP